MKLKVLTLLALSPTLVFAELAQPGFSGEIALIAGQKTQESNFNTEENANKSGRLNSSGESETQALIAPLGMLKYTYGYDNNQQLFFGTSRDDIAVGDLALEIGYKQKFADNTIMSLAFIPTVIGGETWKNPYVTGQDRQETDIKGDAFSASLDNIMGSGLSAQLGIYNLEVDDEESAQAKLERDGQGLYSKLSYAMPFTHQGKLISAVKYISFDADGNAMSFDQYGLKVTLQKAIGRHSFSSSIGYDKARYDETNPVFNQELEEEKFSALIAYEYANIMNWQNWSLISFAGYDYTSANIDFYEEREFITSVGVSYKF